MSSTHEPTCGTAGCFAGLISIVADDIPELKEMKEIYLSSGYNYYSFLENNLLNFPVGFPVGFDESIGFSSRSKAFLR
jgi:hypothetical protein